LSRPTDIVITQALGKKLFGEEDPMGKSILVESEDILTVSGVLADLPGNTTFHSFEYFMPWSFLEKLGWSDDNWGNNSVNIYVEVNEGVTQASVERKIRDITQRHSATIDDIEVVLHALPHWWLYSRFENGEIAGGRIEMVRIFSLIVRF